MPRRNIGEILGEISLKIKKGVKDLQDSINLCNFAS